MSSQGFVKVPRRVFEEIGLYREKHNRLSAYVDLLQLASFDDGWVLINGKRIQLHRGQVASSIRFLENRWGWSRGKIYSFLKLLEELRLIESSTSNGITIVSFLEYDNIGLAGATTAIRDSNEKLGRTTATFMSKYLTPGANTDIKNINRFCSRYIIGGYAVPPGIAEYIKKMPYQEFLQTTYWHAVSHSVKKMSGNVCNACGSKGRLEVHHLTYDHHGDEINHLQDLVCVCRDCHAKYHGKDKEKNRTKAYTGLSLESLMAEETTSEKE